MSDDRYVIDQIRDGTDLVSLIGEHVQLIKKGREWTGLCPFHNDSRPSMSVVTHKGTPFYKCHSCGAGGDAISFLRGLMGMEFREALEMLANRAGIDLPKQSGFTSGPAKRTLREACLIAQKFFIKHLHATSGKDAEICQTCRT